MKDLFGPEGAAELARLAGTRALYVFDFDGTLAPIGPHPDDVYAPQEVLRALHELARRARVAVVSGRRRADLVARLPEAVRYLIGNHGNEGGATAVDAAALRMACRTWRAQLEPCLAALGASVVIEDKALSLSLHYRHARDRERAARRIERCIGRLTPPAQVIGGKLVYNLLPPGAVTKFDALDAIVKAEHAEAVLFVGDDDTDEVVFDEAPPHWLTVRVEHRSDSRARYFVREQSDVARLLDELVRMNARMDQP